jgi:gluconolactonase
MKAETVVADLGILEGPVWHEATGDLTITDETAGALLRVDVQRSAVTTFAVTDGGPNGAYPCVDGGLLVTQNGGLDWVALGFGDGPWPAFTTPGIQRVAPDGTVELLTAGDGPFRAPNDLCLAPDGAVWFTDPPKHPPPPEPVGRVWRWAIGEGRPELAADGFVYCNGIGIDADGDVLIVEQRGLMQLGPDGSERRWLVEELPWTGDGFAFDVDGNVYVAGGRGVSVVSRDGAVVEVFDAPDDQGICTNCCFGGPDLRTLYATDLRGRVLVFDAMPVAGRPMPPVSGGGGRGTGCA